MKSEVLMARATDKDVARFWSKVPNRPEDPSACWEWAGGRYPNGYGQFYIGRAAMGAHRFVCSGVLPGQVAMHLCDNPPCVRPSHLRAGSYSDNTVDADEKGRRRFRTGADHPLSKLTEEAVRFILTHPEITQAALAHRFGVSEAAVQQARERRTWRHVSV